MPYIVVIDDDDQVRGLLVRMLQKAGYTDLGEAADGNQGLARHRERAADLVITDIVMPEKEGLETIQELRRMSPDLRIIAISGGGLNQPGNYLQLARHFGANEVLTKPIQYDDLVAAVQAVLAAP
jgi:CheY-like chemotaxis protein